MTQVTPAPLADEKRRAASPEAARSVPRAQLLQLLMRLRWPLLIAWAVVTCIGTYSDSHDWSLFAWGGNLLLGIHHPLQGDWLAAPFPAALPGGLHIFANYHGLQLGPLPLLLSAGFGHFGDSYGRALAVAFIEILGLAILWLLERLALRRRDVTDSANRRWTPLTTLVGGFIFLQVWSELSGRWVHLDDALAVFFGALACLAIVDKRPRLLAIALGLAVASKPWAIGFVPMVLAFRGIDRLTGIKWLIGALLLPWAPFLIADWRTVHVGDLAIFIQPAAPLTALGLHAQPLDHSTVWRLVQFAAELVVVTIVVTKRYWPAAILSCLAVRLALDPMTFAYYQSSFAVGALAFDYLVWRRPLPIATCIAGAAWAVSIDVSRGRQGMPLLTLYMVSLALVAGVMFWRSRTRTSSNVLPVVLGQKAA